MSQRSSSAAVSRTQMPVPIVPDRGILKLLVEPGDPCKPFPGWAVGSKASFHYRIHSLPFKDKTDADNWFKSGLAVARLATDSDDDDADTTDEDTDSGSPSVKQKVPEPTTTHAAHPDRVDPNKRVLVGYTRNWDRAPFDLRVGRGFSCQLLELAVKTMRIGERARFYCLPPYSDSYIQLEATMREERRKNLVHHKHDSKCDDHQHHHESGSGNQHRCAAHGMEESRDLYDLLGCALEVELELLDVKEPGEFVKETWEMSAEEQWAAALQLKADGNALFQQGGKYPQAIEKYKRALGLLVPLSSRAATAPETQLIAGVKLEELQTTIRACRLNMTAAFIKTGQYELAVQLATIVLDSDPGNRKALFRRGQARLRIGRDLDHVKADFDQMRRMAAADGLAVPELADELQLLQQKVRDANAKDRQMFGNMFT